MEALNRRSLLGAAPAAAAVAMALPALALPTNGRDAYEYAVREAREIGQITDRMNSRNTTDADWESWEARDTRFLDWAERLPLTPDYARARAVAFSSLYERNGGIDEFLDSTPTTDARLALQIIKCVLGAH